MNRRGSVGALLATASLLYACQVDSPVESDIPVIEPEATPAPVQEGPILVPGQYIVVFEDDVANPGALASQLARANGLGVRHVYRSALKGFSANIPPQAVEALRRNPRVRYIEQNSIYQLDAGTVTPVAMPSPPVAVPMNGLRVRLVASDLASSLAEGDGVSSWPNRGSESDAVQPSSSKLPTYHAGGSGFNGEPHIGFNEGRDNDETLVVSGVAAHGSGTLIAVYRQDDANRHNYGIFAPYGGSSNRAAFVTYRSNSGNPVTYWDSSNGWLNSAASLGAGQDHVVMWRVDGSQLVDFTVDGSPAGSVAMPSDMHTPFDRYVIGATAPKTKSRFDGQIAELLFYDRALPDCEADQIIADLGAQYGVSVSVTPGPCDPVAAPSGLIATTVDDQQIDLAWIDNSNNEDGFQVERRLGQTGSWEFAADLGVDATSHSDAGLTADTEYCYRVQAYNADGGSPYSNVDCATTNPPDPPDPPPPPVSVPTAGLRVRLIGNELVATHSDGSDVTSWTNLGTEADASQEDANRLPTFHAGAGPAFNGQAYVGFNEGSDNDEALEIPGVAAHGSGTLIAVFNQEPSTAHNHGLFAPWGGSSSRAAFVTYRSTSGRIVYWDNTSSWVESTASVVEGQEHIVVWRMDGSASVDFQLDGTSAGSVPVGSDIQTPFDRYLVGASEPNTTSRFDGQVAELLFYDRAVADCEADQIVADLGTRYGVAVSVTPSPCSPPATPTGLVATAASAQQIDVTWTDASNNEDGFRLERRLGQTGSWELTADLTANTTAHADIGLAADTEHCYRVQSYNGDGSSSYSNIDCATTDPPAPLPPPVSVPAAGLRVRLVANELAGTLAEGGDVGSWSNLGTEADASQADANRLPTFHAGMGAAFNGQAHVGFNEGSDNDEALEIPGVASHGSGTLIAVFSQEASSAHNHGLFAPWGGSSSRAAFVTYRSTNGQIVYWDNTNGWVESTASVVEGQEHVVVWTMDGSASVDFQLDGTSAGSVPVGSDIQTPFDRYVVGASEPNTTSRFDGQVAELLFYDRALPGCEADQIVADLGQRYGVSVSVTPAPCNPPVAPTGLVATAFDYRQIDLSWTDASGNENGFRIERRLGQTGSWQLIGTAPANATSYSDAPLIPETEYCYRVAAFNDDGVSDYSTVECATTPTAPPGACYDIGNHDDLGGLWNIVKVGANLSETWKASQLPGCEMTAWYFGLDSGVDSDHPDLNVAEIKSFVASEPGHSGEDNNGHGTHTAGTAAAFDGNGGVVGVAPGAPVYGFRVCTDNGQCTVDDIVAGVDEVTARKLGNPNQPMVGNMSLGGPVSDVLDEAVRRSVNAGVVYAIGAGNGILGACLFANDAANVSPARVGDDDINASNGSNGNTLRVNGAMTVTSSTSSDGDAGCNYGNPVTIAAPGVGILSSYLNGGYATISGTSMATPHAAGAAILYLQSFPNATPTQIEAAIVNALVSWNTPHQTNALGRLNVPDF